MREPGASPGRSRRCEGRCSPATTPLALASGGKAAGEGAPSQKTCRAPHIAEPLAEGGFRCFVRHSSPPSRWWPRSSSFVAGAAGAGIGAAGVPGHDRDPGRQGHDRQEAAPDRLALADRDRDALRHRRRQAGHRGRRPVRLPEERPEDDALRASRRTSRRSPRTGRTSSSSRTTRRGSRARSGSSRITVVHHDGAKSFQGAYQQIRQLGLVTGHAAGGDAARPHG